MVRLARAPLPRPLLLLAAMVAGPSNTAAQAGPSGLDIMRLYDAQQRTEDSRVTVDMTLVDSRGESRKRALTMWSRTGDDGARMLLIRFLEPAEVEDTGFLQVERADRDDDRWLYLPALRRIRRIAGSDRQDRFVGTHFTYEDLDPEDLDDHAYRLLREDSVAGRPVWVVEATAREGAEEESGYARRRLWIDRERHVLLRADLVDLDGGLRKRLTADEVRLVPGSDRWRPHRLVMEDRVDGGRTVLEMREYALDQGLDEGLFTRRSLQRGR